MTFLLQPPSHFILAWDRHQICRIAYPVALLVFPLLPALGKSFTDVPLSSSCIPANDQWCRAAGKVTVGLALHWPVWQLSGYFQQECGILYFLVHIITSTCKCSDTVTVFRFCRSVSFVEGCLVGELACLYVAVIRSWTSTCCSLYKLSSMSRTSNVSSLSSSYRGPSTTRRLDNSSSGFSGNFLTRNFFYLSSPSMRTVHVLQLLLLTWCITV